LFLIEPEIEMLKVLKGGKSGKSVVSKFGHSWIASCETEEDLINVGKKLASVVGSGDVVLLKGSLGAGKTTLVRGLIQAKCNDNTMRVTSPSYLLDNIYELEDMTIHHMDLYRLPTGSDLSILDIPKIYSSSLCLIEWPQRMGSQWLPKKYLDVDIRIVASDTTPNERNDDGGDDDDDDDDQKREVFMTPSDGCKTGLLVKLEKEFPKL
jgi:tRNA threonylcarbamoyladenosine biosynthesis protein TsaE